MSLNPSVPQFLNQVAARYGAETAISFKEGGQWLSHSYGTVISRAQRLAHGLRTIQLGFNSHIVIISESRPEWPVTFFAGLLCGAVVVPLDPKQSEQELSDTLNFVQPDAIFASPKLVPLIRKIVGDAQTTLIALDYADTTPISGLSALLATANSGEFPDRNPDEPALIVFTSGSSGARKGVQLSIRNLFHQIGALGHYFRVGPKHTFLSVLPLHHMLELSGGFLTVFSKGGRICYLNSILPDELIKTVQQQKVTHMILVPLLLRLLVLGLSRHRATNSSLAERLIAFAPKPIQPFLHRIRLKWHDIQLRTLIVGGAAPAVADISAVRSVGIDLLLGYGLTETSPVICLNQTVDTKPDSVGKPLANVFVNIDSCAGHRPRDGEIRVKGPNVMVGYYNNPSASEEAFVDGWFATGDVGRIDAEGYVYITGRKKNIIVLDNGKKVSPEEVEAALMACPTISEACVIGIRSADASNEQVVAVIVPDGEAATLPRDPTELERQIKREVAQACQGLSVYKRPVKIFIEHSPLPKTATGKVQPGQVKQLIEKNHLTKQEEP